MEYFIGIDASTTATKALMIDSRGKVISVASSEYGFNTPKPLWAEQQPYLWWNGSVTSIKRVIAQAEVNPNDIKGIGLTGQMHGLVLLDESGHSLRPAILWNDQRTGEQCDQIRARLGKKRLIDITGNDALTGFTAPKILWVQQHEPDIWAKARHILLPKDYVRFHLTGEFGTDRAGAAGTLLFDVRGRDWSDEMLGALEIPDEYMPKTHEGPQITGYLTSEAASITGLREGIPVVGGGGDQAAQAVGVGAVQPGIVALTLGTSGVVFASTDAPYIEPEGRLHAFCHAVPGLWHMMGVMLSAAGSLRWYRDTLAANTSFDDLLIPVSNIPPGSEGLIFLPYLTGERTPHPDPLARSAFVGLTVRHTQAHMTRAVLEGVAFGLRDSLELMKSAGVSRIDQVRVSGGGAKSALWLQILADVMNVELVTVNTAEGAAHGAALLAGVGTGAWQNVDEACNSAVQITGKVVPHDEEVALYQEYYQLYSRLYPALKPLFHELG